MRPPGVYLDPVTLRPPEQDLAAVEVEVRDVEGQRGAEADAGPEQKVDEGTEAFRPEPLAYVFVGHRYGRVVRRERLGGLLSFYHRRVAA